MASGQTEISPNHASNGSRGYLLSRKIEGNINLTYFNKVIKALQQYKRY